MFEPHVKNMFLSTVSDLNDCTMWGWRQVNLLLIKTSLCLMQNNSDSTHGYQDTTEVQHYEDKNSSSSAQDNSKDTEEYQDTKSIQQSEEKVSLYLERVTRENSHSFCSNCLKRKTYIFGAISLEVGCVLFAALFIVKRSFAKRNDDFLTNILRMNLELFVMSNEREIRP
jgi:hypothetical protein